MWTRVIISPPSLELDPGNVENKWATFQDGTDKAAFPAFALAAEASFGAQAAEAATRRHVAILPCSRTPCKLRASNTNESPFGMN